MDTYKILEEMKQQEALYNHFKSKSYSVKDLKQICKKEKIRYSKFKNKGSLSRKLAAFFSEKDHIELNALNNLYIV